MKCKNFLLSAIKFEKSELKRTAGKRLLSALSAVLAFGYF